MAVQEPIQNGAQPARAAKLPTTSPSPPPAYLDTAANNNDNDNDQTAESSKKDSGISSPADSDQNSSSSLAKQLESRLRNIPDDLVLRDEYYQGAYLRSNKGLLSGSDTPTSGVSTLVESRLLSPSPTIAPLASTISAIATASISNGKNDAPVNVEAQVRARIPFPEGEFNLYLYKNDQDTKEHLALVFGNRITSKSLERPRKGESEMDRKIRGAKPRSSNNSENQETTTTNVDHNVGYNDTNTKTGTLVRIHSECFTGETVSSVRCDCGYQLAEAMRLIRKEGHGVIVYLRQEGRNIGLLEKLKAYNVQDMGHNTVEANLLLNHPADGRTYGAARAILEDLGVTEIRLLTNNPDKIKQIKGDASSPSDGDYLDIKEHVPMVPKWWGSSKETPSPEIEGEEVEDGIKSHLPFHRQLNPQKSVMTEADRYLITKLTQMGHMLEPPTHSSSILS
ncbi:GTP cyclohydrolase II [Mycoemilia scoparia]|uniref:GTP cyclohydrolase II n=1 Tax=Mycoemilia scoparia TaxID=417184 RepID=A0A9W8A2F6_9FUNG|nr:GTP cyclohydrolase II [Mycoemilia scoparia]